MRKILLSGLVGFALAMSAFAADPFVGTWKPNPEKFKTSPGFPERMKFVAVTLEATGKDQYRFSQSSSDGKTDQGFQLWTVDGKDHKDAQGDTVRVDRLDEKHLHLSVSTAKGTLVMDYQLSPNRKILTITRKGIGSPSGRTVDEVWVYDKQ